MATPGAVNVAQVALSPSATCVRARDGVARCAGIDLDGQFGDGAAPFTGVPFGTQVGAAGLSDLALAGTYGCGRVPAGLVCWGNNEFGQLGQGTTGAPAESPVAVPVIPAGDPAEIAAGLDHVCVRRTDGTAWCWGRNDDGQLGVGDTAARLTPAAVPGLTGVVSIAAGDRHTCAVAGAAGAVYCWGLNDAGALGDGTLASRAAPTLVAGLTDVAVVRAATGHTCAILRASGAVRCWGWDRTGQTSGERGQPDARSPRVVTGLPADGFTQLALGGDSTCALRSDGRVWCWGSDYDGQLGDGLALRLAAGPVADFPAP